jgi:Ca2+-transporting ATPase
VSTRELVHDDARGTAPVQTLARLDVYGALEGSPRGLTSEEAAARLARVGPNDLPRAHRRPIIFRFFEQFTDLFAVVLIAASAITFLAYLIQVPHDVGNLQLAIAILGVVLLNAVIGFFQEYSAERTAEALQALPRDPRWRAPRSVRAGPGAGRRRRPRGR